MNSKLRARIAALEGPSITLPTVVLVMKDGTQKEMFWTEAMMTVLEHEEEVADIRQGTDPDMTAMCRAMWDGDDHDRDPQVQI